MSNKPTDRLKAIFAKYQVDDQQSCADLVSLYDRKLWHELTVKLRALFERDAVLPDMLQDIFLEFISDFGHKLNLLSFAMFAHKVAGDMDRDAAVELLRKQIDDLKELKGHPIDEPVLLLEMSVAEQCVDITHMDTCKELLDAGLQKLDTMSEVDPSVSAAVHNVAALYNKARQDFAGYYRAALQYLCFVSVDDLPLDDRIALARDISLAALLGDSIYSFAELLLHPVLNALQESPYVWLSELLHCFSDGDLNRFSKLCVDRAPQMNSQPALVQNQAKLKEKITIMSFVALVSALPPDQRHISIAMISARTQLDSDGVEFLLMRAMSLGLVEGTIDSINSSVDITHVAPRVLTPEELAGLQGHLKVWVGKVEAAAELMQSEGVSAIEAFA